MSPARWQLRKRYAEVLGYRMAYVEQGRGAPIVFLHGNPTSSYLWRSVLPELVAHDRYIALHLIGMGDSGKLPAEDQRRYTFLRHREFLDGLLDELGLTKDVTLVVHDWGSALGFDWARRHPASVRAIVYMEALVRPLASWQEWPQAARPMFQARRSPGRPAADPGPQCVRRAHRAGFHRAARNPMGNEHSLRLASTTQGPIRMPPEGPPSGGEEREGAGRRAAFPRL
jgi:pimeloyl-ACP methyl ester carboxylesterase